MSLSSATGTTVSTRRRSSPVCKAHNAPMWISSTLPTITTRRFMAGFGRDGGGDEIIEQGAR